MADDRTTLDSLGSAAEVARRNREMAPGDAFQMAVRGDLQQQFPHETPEQIARRLAAVTGAMTTNADRQSFLPELEGGLRINQDNWARFLAAQPRSTNIVDLRGQPPAQLRPGERLASSTPLYRR